MHLLYLCEADTGGIAEYAVRQVAALTSLGAKVTVLCRPGFGHERFRCHSVSASLPERRSTDAPKWQRMIRQIEDGRAVAKRATDLVANKKFDGLLIACYAEYFAPLWAGLFRQAAANGLIIGTIAHDPVRDFVLGPHWWHRWSVSQAYSFVNHVFVHDETAVDFGGPRPSCIQTHIIPHGPLEVGEPQHGREATRDRYGFSEQDQVFLAFGQIRDGKNLDRFLRVMKELPKEIKLLVAGSASGGSQRRPEAYSELATELGVEDRCVFDFRYIPDEETGDVFSSADVVLMTYSAKFRSASGVLNTAVASRKLVLASSGEGPLRSSVEDYELGVWVAPDDDNSIRDGVRRILADPFVPEWERYERENSWEVNARRVIAAFGGSKF